MSYSTLHTKFRVGETVYFYRSEVDSVQRAKVVGIEARTVDSNYCPKWSVMYEISVDRATDPPVDNLHIAEERLYSDSRSAFASTDLLGGCVRSEKE